MSFNLRLIPRSFYGYPILSIFSGASVENDDNDITIRNADSSWNKSGSKVDPYVGKPHTPAVTWSDGVTGREEAIDSVKTQGNEAPSVFASSTDRLKEVVVQGSIAFVAE